MAAVALLTSTLAVVVACPGAVLLAPWVDMVPSVLVAWLAGQEAGHAAADVLFGLVNPSGRLAVTFPHVENEVKEGGRMVGE